MSYSKGILNLCSVSFGKVKEQNLKGEGFLYEMLVAIKHRVLSRA